MTAGGLNSLTELAYQYTTQIMSKDLLLYSQHAHRKTITIADVKLIAARKNPRNLVHLLQTYCDRNKNNDTNRNKNNDGSGGGGESGGGEGGGGVDGGGGLGGRDGVGGEGGSGGDGGGGKGEGGGKSQRIALRQSSQSVPSSQSL